MTKTRDLYRNLFGSGLEANLSEEARRGQHRLRLVAWATATSIVNRCAAGLTLVVGVAATAGYLGQERFGLWMTLMSFVLVFGFADLGMNSGLVNAVSGAGGDGAKIQKIVSNGFFLLGAVSLLLAAFFTVLYPVVNWAHFFNVQSSLARSEAGPAMLAFVGCFLVGNVAGAIQRIQVGLQLAWRANLWASAGQLAAIGGILLARYLHAGLPWLVAAMSGGPALMWLANCGDFFWRSHPEYKPTWAMLDRHEWRVLLGTGGLFLFLEGMAALGNSTDNIVIARILGAAAVASYGVAQKLNAALTFTVFFVAPLWAAFGDALTRGDYAWARRTLRHAMLVAGAIGVIAGATIFLAGQTIIRIWAGTANVPSRAVLAGFAGLAVYLALSGPLGAILNTPQFLKKQLAFYPFVAIAAFVSKIVLTRAFNSSAGTVWGTFLAFALLYLPAALYVVYRGLRPGETQRATYFVKAATTTD